MIPATSRRVPQQTSKEINRRIRRDMEERVDALRDASDEQIRERLEELDHEWDIERTLEANAATLAFTGCVLAATHNRRWIFLPMTVTAFLFQHAVQGWCPPLPILRRLGFRTISEIDEERDALRRLLSSAGEASGIRAQPEDEPLYAATER